MGQDGSELKQGSILSLPLSVLHVAVIQISPVALRKRGTVAKLFSGQYNKLTLGSFPAKAALSWDPLSSIPRYSA